MKSVLRRMAASAAASTAVRVHRGGQALATATPLTLAVWSAQVASPVREFMTTSR